MVAHIHGRINSEQEEADPQFVAALQKMRIGTHDKRESLTMAELIVAPLLEPFEDRVEAPIRVPFKMAIDGDVTAIADLLGQIGGVEDKLRLEVSVFLRACEEAEINTNLEIAQHFIDETA